MSVALRRALGRTLVLTLFALELALLSTCSPPIPKLEQIQRLGVLKVATINSPTTYYKSGDGEVGFEYDLARRFARELGVRLDLRVVDSAQAALDAVSAQRVHMAAANLSITDQRARNILFTPAIREVTPKLVYHMNSGRPRSLDELDEPIRVPANSAHLELLRHLRERHPSLRWEAIEDVSSEDLLVAVGEGRHKFAVGDSDLIAMTARYHPRLLEVFDLSEPVRKSWAFRHHRDSSLYNAATRFITEMHGDGSLDKLVDRYFGHVDRMDFVSSRTLAQHLDERLPKFRAMFEAAGRESGLDWRLLAAISYQESHWDPKARSVTGVRGLMMLTRATARFVNVSRRTDPQQSIEGGARYFRYLLDRLPDEVPTPDRIWMTLAAYNLGYGHLQDLRELTRKRGGNPNSWIDVRSNLRLLTQRKWYQQTRYGYARGNEAEVYVGNVRTYLDVLTWMTKQEGDQDKVDLAAPRKAAPRPTPPTALEFELPVL